jgi:hypothetical protein
MFVTHRPCGAKPQVKGAQGPIGRRNPMAGRPDFESVQAKTWWLRSHIGSKEDHVPESPWTPGGVVAGNMDGHWAIHYLQTDLIESVEAPLYPNIRIIMVEFTHTTLFL